MKKFFYALLGVFSMSAYGQTTTNQGTGSGTTGNYSSYFGYDAGKVNTANYNSFYGFSSGKSNTTGTFNVFFGANSGTANTLGHRNTFIGYTSGYSTVNTNDNTYVGFGSGRNAQGNYNNFLGSYAGYENTANHNSFIGYNSGRNNTTGSGNIFMGNYSGRDNTTGGSNTFIGYSSGSKNTTAGGNVFLGYESGPKNTTGASNVFMGYRAGFDNSTGAGNTFLGHLSGYKNTTGNYNLHLGYRAGSSSTGSYNLFAGHYSGDVNTGGWNTFYGTNTGRFNTTGTRNTFVGNGAGYTGVTGNHNTFLGTEAGFKTTGSNNIFLGYQAGYNELGSDKLYIANSNTTAPLVYGDFANKILNFNGNVGIGTQTPTAKLHISATSNESRIHPKDLIYLTASNSNIGYDGFGTSIVDFRRTYQNATPHAVNRISFIERGHSTADRGGAITFSTKTLSSGNLAPEERMRIDYTGNVGIGEAIPREKLDVNGSIIIKDGHNLSWGNKYGEGVPTIAASSTGGIYFYPDGSTLGATLRIDKSGNVGVGTSSPGAKLDVNGVVRVSNEGSDKKLQFLRTGGDVYSIEHDASKIYFYNSTKAKPILAMNNNGKVGIGTVNPYEKLHIEDEGIARMKIKTTSTTGMAGILFQGARTTTGESSHYIGTQGESHYNFLINSDEHLKLQTNGVDRVFVASGGKVGIGTSSPSSKLHIVDEGTPGVTSLQINNRFKFRGDGVLSWGANSDYGFLSWTTGKAIIAGNSDKELSFQTSGSEKMVVKTNGNVGIGTSTTGSHKLAVEGSIGAREIKVEATGWSDFVFEKDYYLPTLTEVEEHIKRKGHLKDIPSAKEVEKNGFYLGAMDAKLLQKIEELTLYTIQQEKEINELKELKEENKDLKERLKNLEKLVKKLL